MVINSLYWIHTILNSREFSIPHTEFTTIILNSKGLYWIQNYNTEFTLNQSWVELVATVEAHGTTVGNNVAGPARIYRGVAGLASTTSNSPKSGSFQAPYRTRVLNYQVPYLVPLASKRSRGFLAKNWRFSLWEAIRKNEDKTVLMGPFVGF